jgi:hypothetical protein
MQKRPGPLLQLASVLNMTTWLPQQLQAPQTQRRWVLTRARILFLPALQQGASLAAHTPSSRVFQIHARVERGFPNPPLPLERPHNPSAQETPSGPHVAGWRSPGTKPSRVLLPAPPCSLSLVTAASFGSASLAPQAHAPAARSGCTTRHDLSSTQHGLRDCTGF